MAADAEALEKKQRLAGGKTEADMSFRGSWSGYERDFLFYNPDGPYPKFVNAAYLLGLDFDDDGRAGAPVDIDGDGDLDLVLLSLQGLRLMENTSAPRHFARVRIAGGLPLNAHVRLTAGGVTQQDVVRITDGFQSQVPLDLHFGLDGATKIDRIEVTWPTGEKREFTDLPADVLLTLSREGPPGVAPLPRWPEESRPKTTQGFSFEVDSDTLAGGRARIGVKGKPVVLNFWAPWCVPCKDELPVLARLARDYASAVQFAGISVEREKIDDVRAAGLTYPQFLADEPLLRNFFPDGKAVLPSTFVFDSAGRFRKVIQGRALEESELRLLLDSFGQEDPRGMELERRAWMLIDHKQYEEAIETLRRAENLEPGRAGIQHAWGVALANTDRREEAIGRLRRAAQLDPDNGYINFNLANNLLLSKRFPEAIPHFQVALREMGEDYTALTSLGFAAAATHDRHALSMDAFNRAIKVDPSLPDAWIGKGQLLIVMKKPEEAKKCLEKALELSPGNEDAMSLMQHVR